MKIKLIEKIESIFDQIQLIENELNEKKVNFDSIEKMDKLELGTKVLKLQQLNTELFNSVDIFTDVLEGNMSELSDDLQNYITQIKELRSPISSEDSEDVKKFKELIKTFKNDKNL